jgi:ribonuclease G
MHPHVSSQFTGNQARVLHALEAETGKRFHFTGSEGLPHDYFDVALEGTEEEVREKAIPFREGDEVLVTIVEPHMYAVDDAVAKVDGYIISVSGGGSHVGEKRLVRIEEAGRSSATAVLVDDGRGSANGAPASEPKRARASKAADADAKPARKRSRSGANAEPAAEDDDDEAKPRRKRGRSAPKADKAGSDDDAKPGRSPATDDAAPADDAVAQAEGEESGDDGVESTPRRRGRRGGRRRSAAKAQATSSD